MRGWLALCFVTCAACYRPAALAECDTTCNDGSCPSGQTCGADKMCHFSSSAECSAAFRDAAIDSGRGIDAPPGCRGTLFTACAGTGTHVINGSFSTTGCVGGMVVPQGTSLPDVCVIAADDVELQTARITGPNPLVLVGRVVNVQQGAIVDIASHLSAPLTPGAGADPRTCPLPANPTLKGGDAGGMQTGGGGAGGAFQTSGGAGGMTAVGGGVASLPGGEPMYVLGGCNGGDGGSSPGGAGATGGAGGGALYLVATQAITVDGTINASGAGGGPGTGLAAADAGGAGGGAGGLIALDAPSIDIQASAVIFALGGGGSSGGGSGGVGSSGKEAAGPGSYAASSTGTGGTGGGGSHPLQADPGIGNTGGGGGGGGGGAGFVIFYGSNSIVNTSNIAPPVIVH